MQMPVKKWLTFVEETAAPAGEEPLRKVAIVAVVANPYAGRQVEDLKPMIDASVELGPIVDPGHDTLFGVKTARSKLEAS